MERTIVYVDGFNLYFGIKSSGWNNLKWLDISLLANNITKADQKITGVNYFTSRVRNAPDKEKRQNIYLEALHFYSNVDIIYGKFRHRVLSALRN